MVTALRKSLWVCDMSGGVSVKAGTRVIVTTQNKNKLSGINIWCALRHNILCSTIFYFNSTRLAVKLMGDDTILCSQRESEFRWLELECESL